MPDMTELRASQEQARSEIARRTGYGIELAEHKWKDYFDKSEGLDVSDPHLKATIAIMLENADREIRNNAGSVRILDSRRGFSEDVKIANVGTFDKYIFPMIRTLIPQLAATELVSVQPMSGPVSLVFFMDYLYGTTRGATTAGSSLFTNIDKSYSSQTVESESVGTGTGTTTPTLTNLAFTPVVPSTVTVSAPLTAGGTTTASDDGNGGWTGGAASGTINYATGAITITWSANVTGAITATYDTNTEESSNAPLIDLIVTSSPVTAIPRKLRFRYGLEAAQDLQSLHGIDAEAELTTAVTNEMKFEIDQEIARQLQSISYDAVGNGVLPTWDKNPPAGVPYTFHKETLKDLFVSGSTLINRRSRRATGNWIIAGDNVADIIETLSNFVPNPNIGLSRGVYKIGTLAGKWDIYRDQGMSAMTTAQTGTSFTGMNTWVMGYKGDTFLEAGYVYAPYVPLYTTPGITLDDFVTRKGLGTRYGKRVINNTFYIQGGINVAATGA